MTSAQRGVVHASISTVRPATTVLWFKEKIKVTIVELVKKGEPVLVASVREKEVSEPVLMLTCQSYVNPLIINKKYLRVPNTRFFSLP
jgi:hypothetical protein